MTRNSRSNAATSGLISPSRGARGVKTPAHKILAKRSEQRDESINLKTICL